MTDDAPGCPVRPADLPDLATKVFVVGISHHTAPIAVRERFAVDPQALPAALLRLKEAFGGAAILSTCNRTEVYLTSPEEVFRERHCIETVGLVWGVGLEDIDFYHHIGVDAARHLFRVAAGIDSLVLGESEVLGQVRTAFETAASVGATDAVLSRLFHTAVRVGRRARSETGIGRHALSVSGLAIALSRRVVGDLREQTVLVVGAGEAGKLTGQALANAGVGRLLVSNRRFDRAQALAEDLGAAALPFAEMPRALVEADIVITSTSAPGYVITAADVRDAVACRRERPLAIIDIAVPRDVEPAARQVPGVCLFDMDDLNEAAAANRLEREAEVWAVETIAEDELALFGAWLDARSVVPTISAIRERAEAARRAEVERTLARIQGLSDADRELIAAMSRALVKRILHDPFTRLRADATTRRHLSAARHLFGLDEARDFG